MAAGYFGSTGVNWCVCTIVFDRWGAENNAGPAAVTLAWHSWADGTWQDAVH